MDSVPAAIRLAPRNQNYLLEMARVYAAAKDWDAATALLQRLSTSSDAQVAAAARNDLQDLPSLMKYGVAPVRTAAAPAATSAAPATNAKPTAPAASQPASKAASTTAPAQAVSKASQPAPPIDLDQDLEAPSEAHIDRRPIHYLKGKLLSVDCSQAPAAIVIFSSGVKTLKLKTPDYKSMTLVGADAFSCAWVNRQVSVNYKAVGTDTGDLVSLEVR
jgi:hypothetical protein